ncbi:hypothetical protein ScPMuIL_007848 [Solemya velum]
MANLSPNEAKMLGLQSQIRENQHDLGEYLKELDNWENDIKHKDQELKKTKTIEEPKLPPVRNSLHKKKKKVKKKSHGESGKTTSKAGRISGYDFKAWDKFDVDKACQELESDGNEAGASLSEETDEEWEMERKRQQAIMEKDNGNDYFKRGDYASAIESYTVGIALDPTNPLLPANRAMALLKQEKFAAAEEDCCTALTLDPLYIKAYLRRGTARIGLEKHEQAKGDFNKVLKLEPQNKQAVLELEKIRKAEEKDQLVTHGNTRSDVGVVKAITKPPEEKSRFKPLRRLEIEETGFDDDEQRKAAIAKVVESQSEIKKIITEKDDKLFEKFSSLQKQGSSATTTKRTEPDQLTENNLTMNTCSDMTGQMVKNVTTTHEANKPVSTEMCPLPETSYQFQADYKRFKNNLEAFYKYFKRISPNSYPKLFGEALESGILMTVLRVFKEFYIPSHECYSKHLLHLAGVKRFSTMVMFLSSREKLVVSELYNHLVSTGTVSEEDLKIIANKYEIKN